MKTDQARVRDLVTQTITLMCKNGLEFTRNLRVEGLLAVTVDGVDIFVIHMDEKITDRPSYHASSSHYTENIVGHQRHISAPDIVQNADDVSDLNDGLLLPTSSGVSSKSEQSSAFCVEDVRSVKTEPVVVEDSVDDVMMESGVRSLIGSNIPLTVQGMSECDAGSTRHMPSSPVSKTRKAIDRRTSVGNVPGSVSSAAGNILVDDQLHVDNAHQWSAYTSNISDVSVPLTISSSGETDIFHHANTYDLASRRRSLLGHRSQALVRSWY